MENQVITYSNGQVLLLKSKGKSITRNNEELNLNNFYMIGDNPVVDIQGANSSNYISILVK